MVNRTALIMIPMSMVMCWMVLVQLGTFSNITTFQAMMIILTYRYIHELVHLAFIPNKYRVKPLLNFKYAGLLMYVMHHPSLPRRQSFIVAVAPFLLLTAIPGIYLLISGVSTKLDHIIAAVACFNAVGSSSDLASAWGLLTDGRQLTTDDI